MVTTWWSDDGKSPTRTYLYHLENLGLISCRSRKGNGMWNADWELTVKGRKLFEQYALFRELWESGRVKELYAAILNLE